MKNLKELRKRRNVTQVRLSVAAEVSQETISAYESGKAFPSVETLIKIADFLDTSIDFLLGRTNNDKPLNLQKTEESDELLRNFNKLNSKAKDDVIWYCKAKLERGK